MIRLKAIAGCLLACLSLAACATTSEYTAPSSGPIAGVVFFQGEPVGATGFKWANELSFGTEGYDDVQGIRTAAPLRVIGFTRNTEPEELTTLIPVGQRGYFVVRIETWTARCTSAFSFVPEANHIYIIQPELNDDGSCRTGVIDQDTGAAPVDLETRQ